MKILIPFLFLIAAGCSVPAQGPVAASQAPAANDCKSMTKSWAVCLEREFKAFNKRRLCASEVSFDDIFGWCGERTGLIKFARSLRPSKKQECSYYMSIEFDKQTAWFKEYCIDYWQ